MQIQQKIDILFLVYRSNYWQYLWIENIINLISICFINRQYYQEELSSLYWYLPVRPTNTWRAKALFEQTSIGWLQLLSACFRRRTPFHIYYITLCEIRKYVQLPRISAIFKIAATVANVHTGKYIRVGIHTLFSNLFAITYFCIRNLEGTTKSLKWWFWQTSILKM